MDWDQPLSHFGGKTAFQVSQEAFLHHESQNNSKFSRWLFGAGDSDPITKASQILTYSPCEYGLFRSLVGEDTEKNDFFENQLSREEMRLAEEERLRLESEEKAKQEEEERRLAEEERLLKEEKARFWESQKKEKQKNLLILIGLAGILLIAGIWGIVAKKKKGPRQE
jgi:hypothetical protein